MLPIELLHGVTFGLAWAAGTINCSRLSPPGLETVTQAIFQVWLATCPCAPAACMGCACTRFRQRRARSRCDLPACQWARGVVAVLTSAARDAGIVFRRRLGPGRPGRRPHLPPLQRPRRLCQRRAGPGGRVVPLRAGAGAREVLAQLHPQQDVGCPHGAFRSGSVCLRAMPALISDSGWTPSALPLSAHLLCVLCWLFCLYPPAPWPSTARSIAYACCMPDCVLTCQAGVLSASARRKCCLLRQPLCLCLDHCPCGAMTLCKSYCCEGSSFSRSAALRASAAGPVAVSMGAEPCPSRAAAAAAVASSPSSSCLAQESRVRGVTFAQYANRVGVRLLGEALQARTYASRSRTQSPCV